MESNERIVVPGLGTIRQRQSGKQSMTQATLFEKDNGFAEFQLQRSFITKAGQAKAKTDRTKEDYKTYNLYLNRRELEDLVAMSVIMLENAKTFEKQGSTSRKNDIAFTE